MPWNSMMVRPDCRRSFNAHTPRPHRPTRRRLSLKKTGFVRAGGFNNSWFLGGNSSLPGGSERHRRNAPRLGAILIQIPAQPKPGIRIQNPAAECLGCRVRYRRTRQLCLRCLANGRSICTLWSAAGDQRSDAGNPGCWNKSSGNT